MVRDINKIFILHIVHCTLIDITNELAKTTFIASGYKNFSNLIEISIDNPRFREIHLISSSRNTVDL